MVLTYWISESYWMGLIILDHVYWTIYRVLQDYIPRLYRTFQTLYIQIKYINLIAWRWFNFFYLTHTQRLYMCVCVKDILGHGHIYEHN